MWLLIVILSTLTPDDRIKTVDLEMEGFDTKALCERAMVKVMDTAWAVKHTIRIDHQCVRRDGDTWDGKS